MFLIQTTQCFATYKSSLWFLICGTPEVNNTLNILSGDNQSACSGGLLNQAIVAEVKDASNNPVAGVSVNFSIVSGGGTLSTATATTNASGQAQVNWTLGSNGTQEISISSVGLGNQTANASIGTPIVGGQITDSRDNETYNVVSIGSQYWMEQDLRYDVPNIYTTGLTVDTLSVWGRLYDWNTIMDGATSSATAPSGVQGICPCGWHIPSDAEWKTLEQQLGMSSTDANNTGLRGTTEGDAMKATSGWSAGGQGSNSSGLSLDPAGYYDRIDGNIYDPKFFSFQWSATEQSSTSIWIRQVIFNSDKVLRSDDVKQVGFSLRCVQD